MTCNVWILIAIPADAMIWKDMFCLEPICPLVWGLNPPKEGLCIQNKSHLHTGSRCIYIHCHSCWCKRIEGIRIEGIRVETICVEWCLLKCMKWYTQPIFWKTLRYKSLWERTLGSDFSLSKGSKRAIVWHVHHNPKIVPSFRSFHSHVNSCDSLMIRTEVSFSCHC